MLIELSTTEGGMEDFLPDLTGATDYRKMFTRIDYTILADNATRQDGGEVHLVLLSARGDIGFIIVHDGYDDSYAPMFAEDPDSPEGLARFRLTLEQRIRWFGGPQECYDFFRAAGNEFWLAHRVGHDNPFLVNCFLNDIGYLLREKYNVS